MESSVDQRLSLLLDGEASEFETRRLVEDISKILILRSAGLR